MNNEEKTKLIKDFLDKESSLFTIKSVRDINHKPHPYCIGPRHLKWNTSMYLGESQIREIEKNHGNSCCAYTNGDKWLNHNSPGYTRCSLPYDEHTSQNVAFIQLLRNGENEEGQEDLKNLINAVGETLVDGFVFVETDEKFRIS